MPNRDIILIGSSAGGVDALQEIVRGLSPSIKAAVLVVVHVYPRSRSMLPEILSHSGPLKAQHASDGEKIENGCIYVAPPDHHLVIEDRHMHLSMGPKENHQRPSINVTFRTGSRAYGKRVIGVVLTGQLDDGTAGLWDIKRRGGIAIVQNPEEAVYPSMPLSALREVEADYTVRLAEMAPLLTRLTDEEIQGESIAGEGEMKPRVVDLTCPECRGNIWEVPRGKFKEYRCRVGHTYSPRTMLAEHFTAQEKALWAAVVALEEGSALAAKLAEDLEPELRSALLRESEQHRAQAEQVRRIIEQRTPFELD